MTVLDPQRPVLSSGIQEITGQIPYLTTALYNFGYIPDISRILPGDLILVSRINPGISGRLITASQALLFASGCEWTHAAIYIGDYTIIEANPFKGIHKNVIFSYVPAYRICVRRLEQVAGSGGDAYLMGLQLALEAALRMPKSWYPFKWLWSFIRDCLARPIARFNLNRRIRFANYHVCSSLFAACAMERHGVNVVSTDSLSSSLNVCPAMLRHSRQLVDVDVGWSRLRHPDGLVTPSTTNTAPTGRNPGVWRIVLSVALLSLLAVACALMFERLKAR